MKHKELPVYFILMKVELNDTEWDYTVETVLYWNESTCFFWFQFVSTDEPVISRLEVPMFKFQVQVVKVHVTVAEVVGW